MKTAIIAGASGLIGSFCLQELLNADGYDKVISLGRQPLELKHEKLEQRTIDFENLQKSASLIIGQDVFSCLGTTIKKAGSKEAFQKIDHDYAVELAKIAFKNGAKQFLLVSAMGANPVSRIFYNKVKGDVENSVCRIPFRSHGIFRPSLLLGKRNEFRFMEQASILFSKPLIPVLHGSFKKYRPIAARDVALAMVTVALNPERGIRIFDSGEILEIAERVMALHKRPIPVNARSPEA